MKIPVLFPKIFDYPFTYKSEISESLNSGDFVKAPFGSTEITGVVWPNEQKTEKNFKIKKISKKINVKNLNSSMIEFISWFSKYNLVPLGMSLKMCLLNKDVVEKDFNILSVQRSLKIIGIFSRLFKRDKKSKYLKYIPYTWRLLEMRMSSKIFSELKNILKENVPNKLKKNYK